MRCGASPARSTGCSPTCAASRCRPCCARPTGTRSGGSSSTRSLARQLRAALIDQDARRVARLLKRFRAGAGDRTGSRKLAAKAIRAYERRYKALSNAYADVQREQSRLDREFRENP